MSNIPSIAITAALIPVSSQSNEAMHARRAQVRKNRHHAEDVQELDDTAVDSVNDQAREKDPQQQEQSARHDLEEKIDIASLQTPGVPAGKPPPSAGPPHLDISA